MAKNPTRRYSIGRLPRGRSLAHKNKRSRRARKSINFWHKVDDLTYAKNNIRDVEYIWLENAFPEVTITRFRVPGYENMPRYQDGIWDGFTYQISFTSTGDALKFKLAWWHHKIS